MAQFPNGFHSKQGVHKLIVAEQSKSLFMTSWVTWFISQHSMSQGVPGWQISFPRPRRVRRIQNTRPRRRSVCQRHKLCWQILNSASSTFSQCVRVWVFRVWASLIGSILRCLHYTLYTSTGLCSGHILSLISVVFKTFWTVSWHRTRVTSTLSKSQRS